MEQIELDLEKDSVSTPAGVVSGRRSIANSSQQSATGPWEGVQWQSAGFGEESSKADVSLAVGRLQAPGRGILYFRVRPRTANAPAVQYILFTICRSRVECRGGAFRLEPASARQGRARMIGLRWSLVPTMIADCWLS